MAVRMSDVAAHAGVSTQTVSRVLRGGHWVAPETAARVRKAMEQLGYHGNEVAGALKRGRTRTLGLLFPLLTMSIWGDVTVGAEAVAHERGYSLLLCDTSDSIDKEAGYLSLLLSQRVAGMVYVQPRCRPTTHPACRTLVASEMPVVVISAERDDLPYAHVRTDDERAGYVAIRHLIDVGCRAIAVIANADVTSPGPHSPTSAVQDRIAGARGALAEVRFDADRMPLSVVPNTLDGGYRAGEALLAGGSPLPNGVFATTDAIALGLLEAFRARGVRVPEDVAVVAHDGLLASSVSVPAVTTIVPPHAEMGRTCIDLLLRALAGERLPALSVLDAQLVVRESTIGARPRARRGFVTPLSDPEAWRRWRSQLDAPDALQASPMDPRSRDVADGTIAAVRHTTGGHLRT